MKFTHVHLRFAETDPVRLDLLTGILSEYGFEGFELDDAGMCAYIPLGSMQEDAVLADLRGMGFQPAGITYEKEQNWNQIWEASFQPVIIPGRVYVRAHFHPPLKQEGIELIITPKMSFGTGHHDTTVLMMEALLDTKVEERSVLDFGTGTGILAILAEKLHASRVLAIDNDPWSIANTEENTLANQCLAVEVRGSDTVPTDEKFDIVLANINKNVILAHVTQLIQLLRPHGRLILSGLLVEDLDDIRKAFKVGSLKETQTSLRNGWLCISMDS